MSSGSIILQPVHMDYDNFRLTCDVGFPDEHVLQRIDTLINQQTWIKVLNKNHIKFNPYTNKQHKMWFGGIVSPILKFYGVTANSVNIYALHYELKKKYFPSETIEVGSVGIPAVGSITTMSKEDMSQVMEDVINAYSMLGMNFGDRRFE